jgi:hypothetical protein
MHQIELELEFSGIIVTHQVSLPKLSGYELPAISKWHNVTPQFRKPKHLNMKMMNKT